MSLSTLVTQVPYYPGVKLRQHYHITKKQTKILKRVIGWKGTTEALYNILSKKFDMVNYDGNVTQVMIQKHNQSHYFRFFNTNFTVNNEDLYLIFVPHEYKGKTQWVLLDNTHPLAKCVPNPTVLEEKNPSNNIFEPWMANKETVAQLSDMSPRHIPGKAIFRGPKQFSSIKIVPTKYHVIKQILKVNRYSIKEFNSRRMHHVIACQILDQLPMDGHYFDEFEGIAHGVIHKNGSRKIGFLLPIHLECCETGDECGDFCCSFEPCGRYNEYELAAICTFKMGKSNAILLGDFDADSWLMKFCENEKEDKFQHFYIFNSLNRVKETLYKHIEQAKQIEENIESCLKSCEKFMDEHRIPHKFDIHDYKEPEPFLDLDLDQKFVEYEAMLFKSQSEKPGLFSLHMPEYEIVVENRTNFDNYNIFEEIRGVFSNAFEIYGKPDEPEDDDCEHGFMVIKESDLGVWDKGATLDVFTTIESVGEYFRENKDVKEKCCILCLNIKSGDYGFAAFNDTVPVETNYCTLSYVVQCN